MNDRMSTAALNISDVTTPYARRQAWLCSLTQGDTAALPLTTTGNNRQHELTIVERVTPAQIVLSTRAGSIRVRRKDGSAIGNRLLFVREPATVGSCVM